MKKFKIFFLLFCLSGCVESRFEITKDSRLPIWVELPNGIERNQVTAIAEFHTNGTNKLILEGPLPNKIIIKTYTFTGEVIRVKKSYKFTPQYYRTMRNGRTDIFENPCMGSVFRMIDEIEYPIRAKNEYCNGYSQ